ncbi:hypothetical protein V3C99_015747 [Haemonchus contortus]
MAKGRTLSKGKVVGGRWKILKRIGEGAFGAVYKVEDIDNGELAALKVEWGQGQRSVLRLEAMILRRLEGKAYFAQLLQTGKKTTYSYIVMTLLGESLDTILKKVGRICTVSTQIRIGINTLFEIKQLHDVGFVHRDIKPGNMALGCSGTPQHRFIHIFDFGLAREYIVVDIDGRTKMRRPRPRAHFRGTIRYCSANAQERGEQGRPDDLWCLLYLLVELRGPLPWTHIRDRNRVLRTKREVEMDRLLANCPVELLAFAEHLSLNYYIRPNYLLLYHLLEKVLIAGNIKFTDPYDWEQDAIAKITSEETASELITSTRSLPTEMPSRLNKLTSEIDPDHPFAPDFFATNPLGF